MKDKRFFIGTRFPSHFWLQSALSIAACAAWVFSTNAQLVISGPADPNLDLSGNIVLAEYYGGANHGPLQIGQAIFVQNNSRIAPRNDGGDYDTPNFGPDAQQQALANISDSDLWWQSEIFSIPTVAGRQYRLQLIYHDNYYDSADSRLFDVSAGSPSAGTNLLVANLDIAGLGAYLDQPADVLITNIFTAADSTLTIIQGPASVDNAEISALTLQDLSAFPYIYTEPASQSAYSGNAVQFSVLAAGAPVLSYCWQARSAGAGVFTNVLDGPNTTGSATPVLTLSNVPLANLDYRVVITNSAGSVTSAVATLTVSGSAPLLVTDIHPAPLTQPQGYPFTLSATLAGSLPMTFQWQHAGTNLVDGGRVSGSHSNILTIADAQPGDAGTYQLLANNSFGDGGSGVGNVSIVSALGLYDGSAWTLNGGALVTSPDVLQLTDGGESEAMSAFFNAPVDADAFMVTFTYQDVTGGGADGTAFILQNDSRGPAALGGAGGALGYGDPSPITNSVALQLNIYDTAGMALKTDGAIGPYTPTTPVNLASGDPISVTIHYASGTMAVTLTNLTTGDWYATSYAIDIAAAVGAHSAFIGFSGGDGGFTSIQTVSNFTYAALPAGPPTILADVRPAAIVQPAGISLTLHAGIAGTAPLDFQWKYNGSDLADGGRISGSHSNTLVIGYAQTNDAGSYQLFISNFYGSTNTSPVTVTVTNTLSLNDGSAWSLNGGAVVTNGDLTLTDGQPSEGRSAYLNGKVYIKAFRASFTYLGITNPATPPADGAAFILQNEGPAALGGAGGGLGYLGVAPSAAIELDLNSPGMAFATNGNIGPYSPTSPLTLLSQNPIDVTIDYSGGVLFVSLTDTVNAVSFSTNYLVNLPAVLGGDAAYVGFSGGTGAYVSRQDITRFKFVSIPTMAVRNVNSGSVQLSWPDGIGNFTLQQRSSLGTGNWSNVVNPAMSVTNGQVQVTLSPATGNQFYRLVAPSP